MSLSSAPVLAEELTDAELDSIIGGKCMELPNGQTLCEVVDQLAPEDFRP